MSKPVNPLDVFATYTCHFELHVAATWADIKAIESIDMNLSTTASRCNKTLVINTRKDAHQTIDNVKFEYLLPNSDPGGQFAAYGQVSMTVYEPNGAQFLEKLDHKLAELQGSNLNKMQFGLKIFFVGRREDNTIETITMPAILPLANADSTASFSFKGGEYHLSFSNTGMLLDNSAYNTDLAQEFAYCNKNLTINAKTVKEGLKQLEKKLNDNYDYVIKNLINKSSARTLKYFINVSSDIDGKLNLISSESYVPDDDKKHYLSQDETILSWIYHICRSSDDLNKIVGASKPGINVEGQPNVKLISTPVRFLLKNDVLEIHYDITFYVGGSTNDTYEFDYLFANPGASVDVLSFDITLSSIQAWFGSGSRSGVDLDTNLSSTVPAGDPQSYSTNSQTTDATKPKLKNQVEKQTLKYKSKDIIPLPQASSSENKGMINFPYSSTPTARVMFSTITDAHGSIAQEAKVTIRGNLDLLRRAIMYPDHSLVGVKHSKNTPLGIAGPTWIKLNIRSSDPGHKPFFYTGRYLLTAIDNSFDSGKFIQTLTMQMQDKQS